MSDQELLQRFQESGDNEWLGQLLQRYLLLLFGVCMKYLKKEEDAKDAVQQICLKVITALTTQKVTYFKSWLYMVAKNHCLMQLRGQKGRSTGPINESLISSDPDEEPLLNLLEKEGMLQLLEECLNELNPEQRRCVTLFYLEELSYQQIAEKLGHTLLQVKSHIQNGKRNLKIALDKRGAFKIS